MEEVNEYIDNGSVPNATSYFKPKNLSPENVERYLNQYVKWSKDIEHLTKASGVKKFFKSVSPLHKLEHRLYNLIKEHRKKSRRVSNNFIRNKALQIFDKIKEDPTSGVSGKKFRASNGWPVNFIKRKKLKYKKRKNGKKKSAHEHIDAYMMFLSKLRFDLLSPTAWDPTCHPM